MIDPEKYRKLIEQLTPLRDRIAHILSQDADALAEAALEVLHRIIREHPETDLAELASIIERDLSLPAAARNRLAEHVIQGQAQMAKLRGQMYGTITDAVLDMSPVALRAHAAVDFPAIRHGLNRTVQRTLNYVLDTGGEITDVTRRLQRLRIVGHRARTLANTALAQYDNAANILLAKQAGVTRYKYHGPPAQREFCQALLSAGRFYTLAEINAMDNGQGLPVWSSCGGYNCRHQWLPVPVRDEVSEAHFNRNCEVDNQAGEEVQNHIFGRTLSNEEIIRLTGAPDGSKITAIRESLSIRFVLENPSLFKQDVPCVRYAYLSSGTPTITNWQLFLKSHLEGRPEGIGLRMLQQQVIQAREMGMKALHTQAGRGEDMNGFRVWPTYGYDGPLSKPILRKLPEGLRDAKLVSDLVATDNGMDWWKENGSAISLSFDLDPDGYSMRYLRKQSLLRGLVLWPI